MIKFDDKIALNKDKTGDLRDVEKLLPTRRSSTNTKLTMASIKADYDPEKQWIFPHQRAE